MGVKLCVREGGANLWIPQSSSEWMLIHQYLWLYNRKYEEALSCTHLGIPYALAQWPNWKGLKGVSKSKNFKPKNAIPTVSILIGRHWLNIAIGHPFKSENPCHKCWALLIRNHLGWAGSSDWHQASAFSCVPGVLAADWPGQNWLFFKVVMPFKEVVKEWYKRSFSTEQSPDFPVT